MSDVYKLKYYSARICIFVYEHANMCRIWMTFTIYENSANEFRLADPWPDMSLYRLTFRWSWSNKSWFMQQYNWLVWPGNGVRWCREAGWVSAEKQGELVQRGRGSYGHARRCGAEVGRVKGQGLRRPPGGGYLRYCRKVHVKSFLAR